MGIRMTGIDHTQAGLDVRSVFSYTKKKMAEALEQIRGMEGVLGCVLLSTCNRMELWVSTGETFDQPLPELLCALRGVDPAQYCGYFTSRREQDAVRHLFYLAGGLESQILGEDQIVTQVGEALAFAREQYAADGVLETLFRMAVTAAKKVKTEHVLSPADCSVVHASLDALKREGRSFAGKKCLVIGNGVMGKLAATTLTGEGADVTVTVRQYRSGVVEIPRGCQRIDYGQRMSLFGQCDYVLSATVSPNYTLTKELVEQHLEHPVVLIDLAVPRDFEPAVREVPGVTLYDMDSFREGAASEKQKASIAEARHLLDAQMETFLDWYEGRDAAARILRLREQAAADVEVRLDKKLRHLPLSECERAQLRADILQASQKAVGRMLFELRGKVEESSFLACLDGLEQIYGTADDGQRQFPGIARNAQTRQTEDAAYNMGIRKEVPRA